MRIKWIDNAKGIAILLVIIGHVSVGLQGLLDFDFVYGIHLVSFFLLSGYTLKKRDITREYINQKFSRLMVPYFVTCFAIIFADIINYGIQNQNFAIKSITGIISKDLLRSFFASGSITNFGSMELGTRIGAIWFFPALFFSYLFVQIVINRYEKKEVAGIILFFLAIFAYISARFIWLPFSIQSSMMASIFLYIGYLLRENQTLNKIKRYHYIIALVILALGIKFKYSYMGFVRADCNDLLVSTVVGIAGFILIYGLSILYKGCVLEFIGKRSLVILCTHLFALETMGFHFAAIEDKLGTTGNIRVWIFILLHIIFAVISAVIIDMIKHIFLAPNKKLLIRRKESNQKRDLSIDIAKGIFIILMIVGHFEIDSTFRTIIFSCHMIAFVFLSGYCYNNTRSISQSMRRMTKTLLLPYGLVMICDLILSMPKWSFGFLKDIIIKYSMGVSFTKDICSWCPSVGPVYFILLLFVVRSIYILLDKYINKDINKWSITICISLIGVFLGKAGYWLPWSFDVACYCLVFYRLGHVFRERGWLQWVRGNHIIYFVAAPIWVYMIYSGGMEIAIRKYGKYAIVIIGAIMGVLVVYKLASYIADHLPTLLVILEKTGQASIIILVIHTIFREYVEKYASTFGRGISFLVISTIIQVMFGIMLKQIVNYCNIGLKHIISKND